MKVACTIYALVIGSFLHNSVSAQQPKSVQIGRQIWMSKNLSVSHFSNGDPIAEAKSREDWKAPADTTPNSANYMFEKKYEIEYGKYYNWYAVNDPRGLCPIGWHVPSDQEWNELAEFLGDSAAVKLRSTGGWMEGIIGSNESGFSGMPTGYIHMGVWSFGKTGTWWTSTEVIQEGKSTYDAWSRDLTSFDHTLRKDDDQKSKGFSVRCMKN